MAEAAAAPAEGGTGEALIFKHIFTHTNPGKIADYFNLDRSLLGEGSFGSVHKGEDKATGAIRAIKTINITSIKNKERFEQEIAIQQQLDHPNIVKLFEVFKDARKIYLVLELCTGGELFDRIVAEAEKKDGGAFDEAMGAQLFMQILGAMNYLHERHYVHRDIKPENFLLQSQAADAPIKVIDFGLATRCDPGSSVLKTKAGTPYYVAPQVLAGNYNEKCDIWSCGVILYILLCGYPPFHGDSDPEILRKVKSGRFDFPREEWDDISGDAKDLIRQMLTMDPATRPSATACLEHRWIVSAAERGSTGTVARDLGSRLRSFKSVSRLKKVALTLIAQQLKDEDIEEMRATFSALDKNKDGRLTFQEIADGMAAHKVALPGDLDAILRSIDSDASGQIDFSEFIAATLDRKQYVKREVMWAAFRTFDLDGDGEITKEELKQVIDSDMGDAAIAELIREVDLDGDGSIQFDEFCAMLGAAPEVANART